MNTRIQELYAESVMSVHEAFIDKMLIPSAVDLQFAELIQEDIRRKVIASILITDVVMEEKGRVPTSEDYIQAINKDFGVK